ncbi:hypothetical protein QJQ45_020976 [Haematococcus lacustris]|nr:hypothetical protein QJQ45_020976 [Haematococcus lacustris]
MLPEQAVTEYWAHAEQLHAEANPAGNPPIVDTLDFALRGLQPQFDPVCNLMLTQRDAAVTFVSALPALLMHEQVLQHRQSAAGGVALLAHATLCGGLDLLVLDQQPIPAPTCPNLCMAVRIEQSTVAPQAGAPEQPLHCRHDSAVQIRAVRALLDSSGAPKLLWGEAAREVATLHNVNLVAGLPHTPWEVAFGHVLDVSFLRVLGAPAFIHQPDQLRRKLDSKVAKGIFLRYELGCRSYRVLIEGRVRINKSVVVDEKAVLRRSAPEQQAAPAEAAPTIMITASYQPGPGRGPQLLAQPQEWKCGLRGLQPAGALEQNHRLLLDQCPRALKEL